MKKTIIAGVIGLLTALSIGVFAQISGGGIEGGNISYGTFNIVYTDGWTVNKTAVFDYWKVDKIVVLRLTNELTGTSDSNNISSAGTMPLKIRPVTTLYFPMVNGIDNGSTIPSCIGLNANGTIDFLASNTAHSECPGAGWTSSGTKAINLSGLTVFTYAVGNP